MHLVPDDIIYTFKYCCDGFTLFVFDWTKLVFLFLSHNLYFHFRANICLFYCINHVKYPLTIV
jgi:hypothetical protein